MVVGPGTEGPCTSAPSIEVCIEETAAIPTADPSCRAELKIAPTVPAAGDGVEAKIAILKKKGDQSSASGPRIGRNVLRIAVHDRATDRTDDKGREAESPVCVGRIGEW